MGVYETCRVGMMLECSPVELLTKAAFMHDVDNDEGIMHKAFKGFNIVQMDGI